MELKIINLPTELNDLAVKISANKQEEVQKVLQQIFIGTEDWEKQVNSIEVKDINDKIDIEKLKVGDKVHYQPSYYSHDKFENGIVKEIIKSENSSSIFVVYHWNNDIDNYKNYTAGLTNLRDLKLGWR
ncbi:MAG: hypothetical protein ACOVNU_02745 [Candidatus Kapaibacteriota bacterium]